MHFKDDPISDMCNIVDRRSFGFVGFEPWD